MLVSGNYQALLEGDRWSTRATDGTTVVTYSFANAFSAYDPAAADFSSTLSTFSEADRAMTRSVLAAISAVCNVQFVEVGDSLASQLRYAYSQAPNSMGYAGFAFFPGNMAMGGDIWIGANQAAAGWDWYRPDLVLHETLHAIGLKHSFEGPVALDAASDIIPNTVMSYSPMVGSQSGSLTKYPAQPMVLDIAALQALYGAAPTNAGDSWYDLASAQAQSNFQAVWDAGGWDTLDASRLGHGVTLDLRPGGASDIGVQVNANAYYGAGTARTMSTTTYKSTYELAYGTQIESAIGTNSDDYFIAGAATRTIEGGSGTDTVQFAGAVGNYNIVQYGTSYQLTHLADSVIVTLSHIERLVFADANLQAGEPDATALEGQAFAEAFRLYQAALDRVPDQQGLIFQTQALRNGLTLPQLAQNFMASPEFQSRFGTPDNGEFVSLLYHNVLDRDPEAAGLAYHLHRLDTGATRADILVGFSESPENQAAVAPGLVGLGASGMLFPV